MPVPRHFQRGWTLVELLVGSAVGLLVIAGIGQIYTAAKHSYDIQTQVAEIQDVGRYAVDVLSRDLRMAGYWGLMDMELVTYMTVGEPPPTIPQFLTGGGPTDTCAGSADGNWGRMIANRIFGLNHPFTGYNCIGTDRARGDILTVRYADPVAIPDATPSNDPFTDTRLYIRTAPFQGSIVQGDPQACLWGAPACPTHNFVTNPPYSNHALVAHAYYVTGSGTTVSCGGTSITPPGLARKMLNSSGFPWKESLVNGVEHLQFQYGVDTDTASTDGRVVRYVDANNVIDWSQVVAVRLWVLVRAVCPEPGYNNTTIYVMGDQSYPVTDSYRRALFTTTVALRNCRDEYIIGATPTRYQTKCQ